MFTNYKKIKEVEKTYNLLIENIIGDIKHYDNLLSNLDKVNTVIFKIYKERVKKNITHTRDNFKKFFY